MGAVITALGKIKDAVEYREFQDAVRILRRKPSDEMTEADYKVVTFAQEAFEQKIAEAVKPIRRTIQLYNEKKKSDAVAKMKRHSATQGLRDFYLALEKGIEKYFPDYLPFFRKRMVCDLEKQFFKE